MKFGQAKEFKKFSQEILKQNELIAPSSGIIVYLADSKNYLLETLIDPILILKPCKHDIIYESLCCQCGEKITNATLPKDHNSLAIATGNSSHLKFSIDKQKEIEIQFTKNLIGKKKLLLILDLDNTLIHACVCQNNKQLEKQDPEVVQFQLPGNNLKYVVKFRPYLKYFFEKICVIYDFYIYTMGTRLYAQTVCKFINKLLDPVKIQISNNQIISRDDNFNQDMKSLKRILPFNDNLVLILDDKEDVWKNQKNVVYTYPFFYFNELETIKPVVNGNNYITIFKQYDSFLYFCANNFEIIHRAFYELYDKMINSSELDISSIYQLMTQTVFYKQSFVFSGLVDYSKSPSSNKIISDAKQIGAEIATNFDENNLVTCLITNELRSTAKMKKAKALQIPILHYYFVYFCKMYQYNLKKDTFDLTKKTQEVCQNQEEIEKCVVQDNMYDTEENLKQSQDLVDLYLKNYKI